MPRIDIYVHDGHRTVSDSFMVMSAKLASQVNSKYSGMKGWLVMNHRGEVVYHAENKSEANRVCERFNKADQKR